MIGNYPIGYYYQETAIERRTAGDYIRGQWFDSLFWLHLDSAGSWDGLIFPLNPDITWEEVVAFPSVKASSVWSEDFLVQVSETAKVVEIKPEIIIHMGDVEQPVIYLSPQVDYAYTSAGRRY